MLSALFDRDFDTYFRQAADDGALWLFVHVPKTAGSSLHQEAAAILRPSANIDIDHTDLTRTYQERFDTAVTRFIGEHERAGYRFAAGHINARQVEMIRGGVRCLRCFTMLRSPIARLVSDYRYQRSAMNTARADFVARTPDFETYIARKHVHNKMALHLVPRPMVEAGDVEACVNYILRSYAFVGLQEMYPLSLRTLTTLFGETRSPEAQMRVNVETQENRVVITPELDESLRALNALDIGIFKAFVRRYRAIRPELKTYLRKR